MDLEFEAGLFGQGAFAVVAARLLIGLEDLLHLAVVGLQHRDSVHLFIGLGHGVLL